MVCKKCGYSWDSHAADKGAKRIACSRCKTSITIRQATPKVKPQQDLSTPARVRKEYDRLVREKEQQVKFPVSLWFDKRLEQRLWHLKSMGKGEDHVMLKVDKDGVLHL